MATATPSWWSFRGLEEHADEDTDHPLAPRAAGGGWGWRLIHAGGSGTRKTEAILNLVAGDLPRAMRQHSDPKKAARWIRPDHAVLISPNASEPKYDLLADALEYGDPEVSFERYSPDDEELPTEFDASDRNLLILEDLYNAPKAFRDRVMTPAFTRFRHQGVSSIMTMQSYFDTDKGGSGGMRRISLYTPAATTAHCPRSSSSSPPKTPTARWCARSRPHTTMVGSQSSTPPQRMTAHAAFACAGTVVCLPADPCPSIEGGPAFSIPSRYRLE